MSKESEVRGLDGKVNYIRKTSDDGRTSELHKYNKSLFANALGDNKGERVEVTHNYKDGTSKTYEADNSTLGSFFGGRGRAK